MPSRGDITANEVYADREMLNRLGYGILDVAFGSAGIGQENLTQFTYLVAPHDDPKFYRRLIFDLVGKYYSNQLAKAIWDEIIDHKWVLSERARQEVDLKTAADDWMKHHSAAFIKEWTFKQKEVPLRSGDEPELRKSLLGLAAGAVIPNLRRLLDSGFGVVDVTKAVVEEHLLPGPWRELARKADVILPATRTGEVPEAEEEPDEDDSKPGEHNRVIQLLKLDKLNAVRALHYVQLIANLTGHEPQTPEEAETLWHEILEHKWYMSERAGQDVGIKTAALDYFKRLNVYNQTLKDG
jgi:hypothetical protein